ncbi:MULTISPECIES: DUF6500 family protein [Rahnella]|uniref:DUF6500 family protein n=1 Tax=Rahnella sp. (strain Y9602) TaxID=2703885 RepID=A0ABW6CJW7_RAHSY
MAANGSNVGLSFYAFFRIKTMT